MKFKVKGLVFVGFAAAILSAGAYAEVTDANTVTSKAFTEATYQAKTAANQGGKVLKMASDTAGNIGYLDFDNAPTANSNNLVTSGAVAAAITTSQSATTYTAGSDINIDDNEITTKYNAGSNVTFTAGTGDDAGKIFIDAHDTTVAAGAANGQIAVTRDGTTTQVSVTGLQDTAFTETTTTTNLSESAKIPTAGTVKTYVDNATAASNGTYQAKASANYQVSKSDGTWNALGTTLVENAQGYEATNAVTAGAINTALATKQDASEKASAIDTTVGTGNNDNDHFPTNAAVVSYVGSAISGSNNGVVLPAIDSNTCNSTTPCALVLAGDQPTWVPMAQ